MKIIIALFSTLILMGWAFDVAAFSCLAEGRVVGKGNVDVKVNLTPKINVGQNLIVDLSQSIQCKNDSKPPAPPIIDFINLVKGSTFGGALANFEGSVTWYNETYPLPTKGPSGIYSITDRNYKPLQSQLYLKPIGSAGGVVIKAGDLIAMLLMHKDSSDHNQYDFTWKIYSNNDVVIPTGGCDVSARDVTVNLPDYPGSVAVPVTVHCAQNQSLAYYLTGNTADSANSIFTNNASDSPAQGIGVQMTRNGTAVPTNSNVSLGIVGTSPVNLGLTATYARTSGQVTAGNVQSIIGVTFVYP